MKLRPSAATLLSALFTSGLASLSHAAPPEKAPLAAESFPPADVQLLDGPFKQAMERNADYLLSLDPDRLLHNTRQYAGLKPKGELYGGWESRGIAGHTLGHYLTAISRQYAATGDKRFKARIDYIISEMAECQKAYGDGYVGALPPLELSTLRGFKDGKLAMQGSFNFKGGAWVPWYTQHKVLAGLLDAWVLGGSEQAREVTLKLADWTGAVTASLTPDQVQTMLRVEHGGMLETLTEIYARTGDPRYLEISRRFYHKAILDPLLAGKDELSGKHANTQIPKIIGEARTYEITGDPAGRKISEFFWDRVVNHRSWVIGGNSDGEHFFAEGQAARHLGPATAETCNTYNMLKLTEHLFEWTPSVPLADFYERALYNQILASQEPKHGMFTYFFSLKPGHSRVYSTPTDSFWCCVGTGMENHTKYGEAIYFHGGDSLYVNLFIPSALTWKEKGLGLRQETQYPRQDTTEFTITAAPAATLALKIRCPAWVTAPLSFQLNGQALAVASQPGQFAEISRVWKKGDRLRVTIPMGVHTETLERDANKIAFLYGPVVLAGDLGPAPETKTFPYAKDQGDNFRAATANVPALVRPETSDLAASLQRVPGEALAFRTARPSEVTLRPLTDIPYNRYNVYWDVVSSRDWENREAALRAEADRRRAEEARIVDELSPGEQQSEVDHRLSADKSKTGDFNDRKWRSADGGGFFEFQMKVLRDTPQILRCTYWGGDTGARKFDILVNGQPLATQQLNLNQPGKFFTVEYPLPPEALAGKTTVLIRFQPQPGNIAGGLFGCVVLKADQSKP